MPPLTLAAYQVRLGSVVDFRAGFDPSVWPPLWQELNCNWRQLAFVDRIEPPSWVLSDEVLAAGHNGILFPSTIDRSGVNLVVYVDALVAGDSLTVHDPEELLPCDRSSWPAA